ncbi:hypothetical protein [Desulfovibrio subterraneus]|uniref:Uncharacterized protein n=1 Tax=Desulfovibrio subterraneus TaxID=2718620 RepID=A0A7J0BL33_9BACT|nr:hypothetical protein [Desulfovibrio subterraneus]GFM34298.1 hypothetical protein DSM101010T_26630 [Desulfovibrio subterraneus]
MLILSQQYTIFMVFILLCFAGLMVMFYFMLRSMEEMTRSIRNERNSMNEVLRSIEKRMAQLVTLQRHEQTLTEATQANTPKRGVHFNREGEVVFGDADAPFDRAGNVEAGAVSGSAFPAGIAVGVAGATLLAGAEPATAGTEATVSVVEDSAAYSEAAEFDGTYEPEDIVQHVFEPAADGSVDSEVDSEADSSVDDEADSSGFDSGVFEPVADAVGGLKADDDFRPFTPEAMDSDMQEQGMQPDSDAGQPAPAPMDSASIDFDGVGAGAAAGEHDWQFDADVYAEHDVQAGGAVDTETVGAAPEVSSVRADAVDEEDAGTEDSVYSSQDGEGQEADEHIDYTLSSDSGLPDLHMDVSLASRKVDAVRGVLDIHTIPGGDDILEEDLKEIAASAVRRPVHTPEPAEDYVFSSAADGAVDEDVAAQPYFKQVPDLHLDGFARPASAVAAPRQPERKGLFLFEPEVDPDVDSVVEPEQSATVVEDDYVASDDGGFDFSSASDTIPNELSGDNAGDSVIAETVERPRPVYRFSNIFGDEDELDEAEGAEEDDDDIILLTPDEIVRDEFVQESDSGLPDGLTDELADDELDDESDDLTGDAGDMFTSADSQSAVQEPVYVSDELDEPIDMDSALAKALAAVGLDDGTQAADTNRYFSDTPEVEKVSSVSREPGVSGVSGSLNESDTQAEADLPDFMWEDDTLPAQKSGASADDFDFSPASDEGDPADDQDVLPGFFEAEESDNVMPEAELSRQEDTAEEREKAGDGTARNITDFIVPE